MNRKRILALGLGLVLTGASVYGCTQAKEVPVGNEAETKVEQEKAKELQEAPIPIDTEVPIEKGARIAVVVKSTTGEFWKNVKKGMEDAIVALNEAYGLKGEEKLSMTFEGPEEATDLADMLNAVDAVLAENPSVLCLAAGDEEAGTAQLETAKENGIPVVLLDSLVAADTDLYMAYCGSDDKAIGRDAALQLTKALGGSGEVAIISHWKTDQTSVDRVEGFTTSLAEKAPDIKLVGEVTMEENGNLEEQLQELLEIHPELTGIFCTNIDAATAALEAIEALEADQLQVVGVDGSSSQITAIKEDREVGVISQNPYEMGFTTIYLAAQAAAEVEIPKTNYINHIWIDKNNLEKEEILPYLYK